ncbi:uncharacterized protein LACBIDRAFT_302313 [Laccaria bicolor S238N-H82]|uniref:Predicted protein n=1 Tax=Laccaria bicolor (strain S238N-H82 / ATCC MYA-4686) TaxID=486041 RepID=B0DHI7_LACBS|nr:uncharacterized protein LACBIDRAFT_302313 [Laccaria bicolor S238N-H82]EDR06112.1 predicted protein [Laccaria bicolor S238N-H82]|eukprot:XP_001883400.1 predicted protein [Laccaria bicolor S238N-H82]
MRGLWTVHARNIKIVKHCMVHLTNLIPADVQLRLIETKTNIHVLCTLASQLATTSHGQTTFESNSLFHIRNAGNRGNTGGMR